ncbi:MAG: helix-turn-helix transcriptional regulator [bacterium]|nr:helix-turn-helix transcriptional regulator [bacterium]
MASGESPLQKILQDAEQVLKNITEAVQPYLSDIPGNTGDASAGTKERERKKHAGEAEPPKILLGGIHVSSRDTAFIDEVRRVIEKNLADPAFNVDHLAEKLYMDRSGLYRKVKACTGQSPVQFIRSYRLDRSRKLLETHFGNVTQVALEVGFSNVAYFSKCFKKQFRQLPSAYRG